MDRCLTCIQRNLSYRALDSPSFEVSITSYDVGFNMPGLSTIFSVQQVPYLLMGYKLC